MSSASDPLAWLGRTAPGLFRLANEMRLWAHSRWRCPGTVTAGPRNRKRVALTFDDGPDERWTPAILDILRQNHAQATFFMLGQAMTQAPALVRQVAAEGHQIGTHLFSHSRQLGQDRQAMLADLERALEVHREVLGNAPRALRFPYGQMGRLFPSDLTTYMLTAYHWSFSSHDSRAQSPERITNRVGSLVGPGDIILMHDGYGSGSSLGPGHRDNTVTALPLVLETLKTRGLAAVTLNQLCNP